MVSWSVLLYTLSSLSATPAAGPKRKWNIVREDEFAKRIEETCDWLGLTWHHETDSRKSKAGFPDYCIVGYSVMFLEIKSSKGKVSPKQQEWIDRLAAAEDPGANGVDAVIAYVAYPDDWDRVLSDLKLIAGKG